MPHYVFILPPFTFCLWLPLEVCSSLRLSPQPLLNEICHQRNEKQWGTDLSQVIDTWRVNPSTMEGEDLFPAEGRWVKDTELLFPPWDQPVSSPWVVTVGVGVLSHEFHKHWHVVDLRQSPSRPRGPALHKTSAMVILSYRNIQGKADFRTIYTLYIINLALNKIIS